MGIVVNIADFKVRKRDEVQEADREMLHMEFSKAACLIRTPDFQLLSKKDSYFHAHFAFHHAQAIASHMECAFLGIDAHPLELEVCRTVIDLAARSTLEIKDGVCLPVIRREWNRSVDTMIDNLTEMAVPLLNARGSSRSDVPNPRSA